MRLWVLERRLAGLAVVLGIIIIVLGSLFYKLRPQYSCDDGIKNGDEAGIDCGGDCAKLCLGEIPRPPVYLWQRFFPVRSGVYDVGALVDNQNLFVGARTLNYTFKLYDAEDLILAERKGSTYLYPNDQVFLFEANMVPGPRTPTRVELKVEPVLWERFDEAEDPLMIDILSRSYEKVPHPIVRVNLRNRSVFEVKALEVVVILEKSDDNAYAASSTTVESLGPQSEKEVVFAWPTSDFPEPSNIRVLYRRILQ